MQDTLGLDDEWGAVEVVIAVENAFRIKIEDEEAERILLVGELFDLLLKKILPIERNRKYATAMAFYRLRRALNDIRFDKKLSPSTNIYPATYTESFVKTMQDKSGLQLPKPESTWIGQAGDLMVVFGILGILVGVPAAFILGLIFDFSAWFGGLPLELLFAGMIAGAVVAALDSGRLPKECETLGQLAEKVGALNYGTLIDQGAGSGPAQIWRALTHVLSEVARVPALEIDRDTYFLQTTFDTRRKAAA